MSRVQGETCRPQQGKNLPSEQVPADRHQEERIQGGGARGGEKVLKKMITIFKKSNGFLIVCVCVCVYIRVYIRVSQYFPHFTL